MPMIVNDGRHCLKLFPQATYGVPHGYLYAFETNSGHIKIGKTSNPRTRAVTHWGSQKGAIVWFHLFSPVHEKLCWKAEKRAMQLASQVGSRLESTEWFVGLTKKQAIACCRAAINEHRAVLRRSKRKPPTQPAQAQE